MRKASSDVIEWVRSQSRRKVFVYTGGIIVVVLAFSLLWFGAAGQQSRPGDCVQIGSEKSDQDSCIELELVSSNEEVQRGLSGREAMPIQEGMLFDFGTEGIRCMWMKDMHFSLDMIWLDSDGTVVDIETHVSPDTFPDNFCGQEPARYVIEVNAGVADQADTTVGQQIEL